MSADPEITYSQIFTLTELISAPLIATVEGDFYAAERFVNYLRKYAFEQPDEKTPWWDFGKLRMVVFQYRTPDGWMEMQIPVLSLIPMPLLSVSDARFRYNLRIFGLLDRTPSTRDPAALPAPLPLGDPVAPQSIMGSFAPLRNQREEPLETPTLVANMDINIQMRQSDLPAGIAAMLNLVQSSVEGTLRHRIQIHPAVAGLTQANPTTEMRIALLQRDGGPLARHPVNIAAEPAEGTAHLRPPKIVAGTLVSRSGDFSLVVATDNAGAVVLEWSRGAAPKAPLNVSVQASAQVDFPGNQFGPVKAAAELQIFPAPSPSRSE